jgi:hypothetical protein
MNKIRLSSPIALMIEQYRLSGISDELLLECFRARSFGALPPIGDGKTDAAKMIEMADEIGNDWEGAIVSGYEFSFITITGVRRLLSYKYRKQPNADFQVDDLTVKNLVLRDDEIDSLSELISRQWNVVVEQEPGQEPNERLKKVRIELKYQNT